MSEVREIDQTSPFTKALGEYQSHEGAVRVCIVAAVHIQPSDNWIGALNAASKTATIIIVDDSDGKVQLPEHWDVFGYDRQKEAMGIDLYSEFERFHHSSSCKAFGLWLAYQRGFDPVIVIDSDCVIPPDFVAKHVEMLMMKGADRWSNPLEGTGWYSRGFPYALRSVEKWAHMGLWEHELDLYGSDRVKALPTLPPKLPPMMPMQGVSVQFFPLSGMNVSFRHQALPWMLFLPNFTYGEHTFRRHDDIWGGYIFQRVCEMARVGLSYGDPLVFHETVVVPEEDAAEEIPMIKYEEEWYQFVDKALASIALKDKDFMSSEAFFEDLADLVEPWSPFNDLEPVLRFWARAFHVEDKRV